MKSDLNFVYALCLTYCLIFYKLKAERHSIIVIKLKRMYITTAHSAYRDATKTTSQQLNNNVQDIYTCTYASKNNLFRFFSSVRDIKAVLFVQGRNNVSTLQLCLPLWLDFSVKTMSHFAAKCPR